MKSWNQLFIRQGFMVKEVRPEVFACLTDTEENIAFLLECLEKLTISYTFEKGLLTVSSEAVPEESWIKAAYFRYRGRGEGLWFRPGVDQPKVKEIDTYIAGLVRQLNRLGFFTSICCDGHGDRRPLLGFASGVDMEQAAEVLLAAGIPNIHCRNREMRLRCTRELLPDIAENLSYIQKEWLGQGSEYIKKQLFFTQLEQLLSISLGKAEVREKYANS